MKILITLLLLFSSFTIILAQKECTNRFDTTLSRKHELSVAFGMGRGVTFGKHLNSFNRGPSFSVEYARVYRHNHFLRLGVRGASGNSSFEKATSINLPPSPEFGDNQADNYTTLKSNKTQTSNIGMGAAFVGYEYGVGKKKLRFTFGVDLYIGYGRMNTQSEEVQYLEQRNLDTLSGFYNYSIQFQKYGQRNEINHLLMIALSPRIGLRRDFNHRLALAVALTPQIGFLQRVGYESISTGNGVNGNTQPKRAGFFSANADIRLIIKLGKKP